MNKTEKKIPSLCTDVRTNHKRRKWRAGDIKAAGLPSWQLSSSFWLGLCGAECHGALQSIIYQGKDCRPASPCCDAGSPQPLPPSTTATVNSRWHFSLLPYPRIQTTRPYSLEATSGVGGAAAHSSRYRSAEGPGAALVPPSSFKELGTASQAAAVSSTHLFLPFLLAPP